MKQQGYYAGGRHPNLIINLSNYELKIEGETVDIPPKELELLYFCARTRTASIRVSSFRGSLGLRLLSDSRTVDVHVKRLR